MNRDELTDTNRGVQLVAKGAKWAVLIVYFIIAVFPILWLFLSAFKTNYEIQTAPFAFPTSWQVSNFVNAITVSGLPQFFMNSVIVAVSATVLNLLTTSMASFVLSREEFALRKSVYTLITAGVLVPIVAFMVPYFAFINKVGLYDTLYALILTYAAINIPISVFLVTSFMATIPKELEDAADIDGCSFWQRFALVVFPLSRPGLVTAGTFSFIYCWNEFIYALLLTSSRHSRTLQLGIRFFTSQFRTDYARLYAAIILTIIPSVIVYIFLHEKIIAGLTAGAVKG